MAKTFGEPKPCFVAVNGPFFTPAKTEVLGYSCNIPGYEEFEFFANQKPTERGTPRGLWVITERRSGMAIERTSKPRRSKHTAYKLAVEILSVAQEHKRKVMRKLKPVKNLPTYG